MRGYMILKKEVSSLESRRIPSIKLTDTVYDKPNEELSAATILGGDGPNIYWEEQVKEIKKILNIIIDTTR
eukprot:snap_masked-scaffold_46-processed-gene-1.16-mRNA-1 protein AED:1.00 eAED:1.00 QI:0/-1/0/0/-1/1/1/0/70